MPATRRWCPAFLGAALLVVPPLVAQQAPSLPMPRNVARAYAVGTRSPDGRPGPRYWQNRARYTIDLAIELPDPTVQGREEIVYLNHSPDTLRTLGIKLFMNQHRPGAPRMGGEPPAYLTDGVTIDEFSVNGAARPWREGPGTFTNATVPLPAPLLPGDSVRLGFTWHFDLATGQGREGVIDSTSFFLAYFYPRIAVYDDHNGWDRMDFTGSQEFYNDFNDYDVTIRAPHNVVVWGTGTLENPGEVLQPRTLARYQASLTSDSVIRVASREEMAAGTVTRQEPMLAWRFRSRDVPDVTFGLSRHYTWDAGSVVVDTATGRRASVQAAFADTAADYHHMVRLAGGALAWLSRHWPGVPYPYEKTTVFLGYADMEYPMVVNDQSFADTAFSRFVVAHELAHTWFPFYMGINETRYPFMDEGWATALEYLINVADMGAERADAMFKQFRVAGWTRDASPQQGLPIITPGDILKGPGYGNNAYGKPALGYLALKDLLGDEQFGRALRGYMERWHGKHPTPWDFFASFNDLTGRDLDWFWTRWFLAPNHIDLAVRSVTGRTVALANIGGMPAPVDLVVTFADGRTARLHQTAELWRDNPGAATVTIPGNDAIRGVALDGGIWMDANPADNGWTAP